MDDNAKQHKSNGVLLKPWMDLFPNGEKCLDNIHIKVKQNSPFWRSCNVRKENKIYYIGSAARPTSIKGKKSFHLGPKHRIKPSPAKRTKVSGDQGGDFIPGWQHQKTTYVPFPHINAIHHFLANRAWWPTLLNPESGNFWSNSCPEDCSEQ